MKKLTRQERLDVLSKNGFYSCGHVQIKNIEAYIADFSGLKNKLTETFADKVRANNTKLSIVKVRSNDFIDNEACFYNFRGKTYQYGKFIVHIYTFPNSEGGMASVSLLA